MEPAATSGDGGAFVPRKPRPSGRRSAHGEQERLHRRARRPPCHSGAAPAQGSAGGRASLDKRLERQAKARARAQLGTLRGQQISPSTQRRYEAALRQFFLWRRISGGPQPQTVLEWDEALCAWAEALWQEGDSKAILANGLLSCC